ncbi:type VI secretion system-associated FHA domain protein TagH [Acidisphaera sp. L21]|uniref:type VI secretion system-associated FHA domain protein TagH n=1 Tax=Acidisphaera sp. L21 TaxID=1641851 RepID=UPI00131B7C87|nr:type VI secretion system-associated FHA domain protein TagH [Acidisphaera sp. L21]
MGLTLTTLRCPDSAAPESRQVSGGEFSIGRGPGNDWVLADPDRHLSKRHCVLAYRSGQWQLSDVSSNGTFVNRDTRPVGAGTTRTLRTGDRLRVGDYEIELTIGQDEQYSPISLIPDREPAGHQPTANGYTPSMLDPFGDEPSQPVTGWNAGDPLLHDSEMDEAAQSARLPSDFDPLHGPGDPFQARTQSDHSPSISDAFRPPPPPAIAIPDDWDLDLSPTPAPPPRPAVVAPPMIPDEDSVLAPPPRQPEPRPLPPPSPAPLPPVAVAPPAPTAAADVALLAAFLRGTGLSDADPPDPVRMMEAVGATLRATVAGIRETLIARASIKGEFRIEQTLVRASGNNPLKFSAGDDDAMAALLGIGRRNTMAPDRAVTEAMRDMRLHELATMSAMQAAIRTLLGKFDPATIEKTVEANALDKLPGQRRARAWDAFSALHQQVSHALSDDFDSVFGKAFARAYEQALRDATAGEDDH